jgi:murein DD-endopeptidase MepM/ murein hydrolase activator NlpD
MATTQHIRSSAAAVLLVAASLLAAHVDPAAAQPGSTCGGTSTVFAADTSAALSVTQTFGHTRAVPAAYGWPVKPFDRQHPVRANLNDPRIGHEGGTAFHFGIDISVPDGTPVYAVTGGEAYVRPGNVSVADGGRHSFGYWHVRAAVVNHQQVRRHQLLGWVNPGWEHVHFAELAHGVYLNPLRPGGLGPYADVSAPEIGEITLKRLAGGGFQVLANAYDTPSPRVPGGWTNEPVSPALLQWRVFRNGHAVTGWQTAADFRTQMLDRKLFESVYAPPTRQNHKGKAGLYCFFLSHEWKPADGTYRIEVAASDTRENRAVAHLDFTIGKGQVQS